MPRRNPDEQRTRLGRLLRDASVGALGQVFGSVAMNLLT
jgi:hypothetical protein